VAQLLAELDFFVGAALIPTPDGANPIQEGRAEVCVRVFVITVGSLIGGERRIRCKSR
jgi:hypothetical protein